MNFKYTLIVKVKNKKSNIESYYGDNAKQLKEYAEFRRFNDYKIYELKEVKDSDNND